jgi:hypothetical protein
MAKKDKQDKTPYFISAEFDTEGLVNLPPETKPDSRYLHKGSSPIFKNEERAQYGRA